MTSDNQTETPVAGDAARRAAVLESALSTFARYGYRKTSMDEVARAAKISRPGLYFLFSSKEALFRAAVERALLADLDAVEAALTATGDPLGERLLEAFDAWAGRYVGPLARDVTTVVDENPDLLGTLTTELPRRFADMIVAAIREATRSRNAADVTATLISVSIGIKYQENERSVYHDRMRVAIALILGQRERSQLKTAN